MAKQPARTAQPARSVSHTSHTPMIEWIVAALGAAMLIGLVVYLVWCGMTRSAIPPQITVVLTEVYEAEGGYVVAFTVRNTGDLTAASVSIVGEIVRDGDIVATGRTVLDFVPESSERNGGLIFAIDPRDGKLVLRAEGYVEP
ncbi:MAG: hypothetical protein WEC00_08290 [Dongiaceae bacterium]